MASSKEKSTATFTSRLALLLRQNSESILLVVLMAVILRWLFIGSFQLESQVMEPTLRQGELVFAGRLPFGWTNPLTGHRWMKGRAPRRGEIVVFECGRGSLCLRRVIGVAGDRVEMVKQRLKINDELCIYERVGHSRDPELVLRESCLGHSRLIKWASLMDSGRWSARVVPPSQVLLAGDFRSESAAAPLLISEQLVRASVWRIWLSWTRLGPDWSRFGLYPD